MIADTDGDGLTDGEEVNTYGTNPNNADSDADGLSDGDEVNTYGTDPNDTDSDNDGLSDFEEVITYQTNPNDIDSDVRTLWILFLWNLWLHPSNLFSCHASFRATA